MSKPTASLYLNEKPFLLLAALPTPTTKLHHH
jgi:hypothetical protein